MLIVLHFFLFLSAHASQTAPDLRNITAQAARLGELIEDLKASRAEVFILGADRPAMWEQLLLSRRLLPALKKAGFTDVVIEGVGQTDKTPTVNGRLLLAHEGSASTRSYDLNMYLRRMLTSLRYSRTPESAVHAFRNEFSQLFALADSLGLQIQPIGSLLMGDGCVASLIAFQQRIVAQQIVKLLSHSRRRFFYVGREQAASKYAYAKSLGFKISNEIAGLLQQNGLQILTARLTVSTISDDALTNQWALRGLNNETPYIRFQSPPWLFDRGIVLTPLRTLEFTGNIVDSPFEELVPAEFY